VVFKGLQVLAATHPLTLLGFVGGSLALLGLYDAVSHFRQSREAQTAAATQPPPENIW
jgi:hypothetical protein